MKSLRIYLIAAACLLVIYTIMQLNRPTPTNWSPTYYNNQKKPYDTYILYKEVKNLFPKTTITPRRLPAYQVLTDTAYQNTAYIIISNSIAPDEAEYKELVNFIQAGNTVFIAADNFGGELSKKLSIDANNAFWQESKSEYVTFVNPRLNNERQYYIDKGIIDGYFTQIDTAKAVVLGQNDANEANFVKYPIGKGNLYLMANPRLLTNYSLLKENGLQYASVALSHIGTPKHILWDEYYTKGAPVEESPMRVFLTNNNLRSAYYLAVSSLLIYVLYGIKRRQRIIPVVEPVTNTTLSFVNVVGQVYYERRDNKDIAHKKIIYFLTFLRDKYRLRTGKMDYEFVFYLTKKTGIDKSFISELTDYINYITHQQQVTDTELLELNRLMEKFYTLSA